MGELFEITRTQSLSSLSFCIQLVFVLKYTPIPKMTTHSLPTHAVKFSLVNRFNEVVDRTFINIVKQPFGNQPGRIVYSDDGGRDEFSFSWGQDALSVPYLVCWSSSQSTFIITLTFHNDVLESMKVKFQSGEPIDFVREIEYYQQEIEECVPEMGFERALF